MQQEKAYEKFWSKEVWIYGLFIVAALATAFYWTAIRPDNIRKQCYKTAQQFVNTNVANNENLLLTQYTNCVAQHGLPINISISPNSN